MVIINKEKNAYTVEVVTRRKNKKITLEGFFLLFFYTQRGEKTFVCVNHVQTRFFFNHPELNPPFENRA